MSPGIVVILLGEAVRLAREGRDPEESAKAIENFAYSLVAVADMFRCSKALGNNSYCSPGGMSDRVQAQVVGPDGNIKQVIDTGRN